MTAFPFARGSQVAGENQGWLFLYWFKTSTGLTYLPRIPVKVWVAGSVIYLVGNHLIVNDDDGDGEENLLSF